MSNTEDKGLFQGVRVSGYKLRPGDMLPARSYVFSTPEERIAFLQKYFPQQEAEPMDQSADMEVEGSTAPQ